MLTLAVATFLLLAACWSMMGKVDRTNPVPPFNSGMDADRALSAFSGLVTWLDISDKLTMLPSILSLGDLILASRPLVRMSRSVTASCSSCGDDSAEVYSTVGAVVWIFSSDLTTEATTTAGFV